MIHIAFEREVRPGETLRGDVRVPDGPPPRAAVVLVHGFKGFKDWGFFPWLSRRLVGAGFAAVTFDFSRNGMGADPDRLSDVERFGSNTLSLEQEELRSVVHEAIDGDLLPRRPRSLVLLGYSRGGAQAVLAAAREPRVSALVTWSAISHFDRWTEETKEEWRADGRVWVLDGRTGVQLPVDVTLLEDFEANREGLDVTGAAARVGAPWLIVHGREDLSVWPGEAEALAHANPSARLAFIEGAGHGYGAAHPFAGPTPHLLQAWERTLAHLRRHVAV